MQAVPMPIIYSTPSGLQVKGRRCLERMAFEDVLEDLQKHLTEELNRGGGSPVIQDLDLAQNMLSLEQFENLFFSLGVASAHVVRFRLFGCPTLDDEAMRIFAEYLRTSENAPAEMHLSDCAITTEGFQHLMSAIEETDLYPLVNANVPGEGLPLYLRLENNYIGQEAIQEKIDAGLIQTFDKQQGRRTGHQSGPKVNLLAKDTHFRQKQGPPPTPEAARPPKFVNDRNAARPPKFVNDRNAARPPKFVNDRNEGHSESHVPRGCCQASPSQPIAVPQHSHHQDGPPSAFLATPDRPRPIAHITISKTLQPRPKTAQPRPPPKALQPQPKARPPQPKARPPQPKAMPFAQTLPPDMDGKQPSGSKCVVQPSKRRNRDSQPPSVDSKAKKPRGSVGEMLQLGGNKPSKKPTPQSRLDNPVAERTERMPKLPYPWQEHFDEQRGVSYFWNAKTGDSVWERPTS